MRALVVGVVGLACAAALAADRPKAGAAPAGAVAFISDVSGPGPVTITRGTRALQGEPHTYLYATDRLRIGRDTVVRIVTTSGHGHELSTGVGQPVPQPRPEREGNRGMASVVARLVRHLLDRLCHATTTGEGTSLQVRGGRPPLTAVEPAQLIDPSEEPAVLIVEDGRGRFYCTECADGDLKLEIWQNGDPILRERIADPDVDRTVEGIAVAELEVKLPPLAEGVMYRWVVRSGYEEDEAFFRVATAEERREARELVSVATRAFGVDHPTKHLAIGAAAEAQGRCWRAMREYSRAANLSGAAKAPYSLLADLARRAGLDDFAQRMQEIAKGVDGG